jgi:hypothetical protein
VYLLYCYLYIANELASHWCFWSILTLGLMVLPQPLAEINILSIRRQAYISMVSLAIVNTMPDGATTP